MYRLSSKLILSFLILLMLGGYSRPVKATDQQTSSQVPSSLTPSSTVLRATTRLVVVDVVATDNKGEPVTDLKAEDFTVLEDGKPQKISGFSFKHIDKATPITNHSTVGTFSNAVRFENVNALNVILLDGINGNFDSYAYGKDRLFKFLDKGTLKQPTALYALEDKLTLLHDFTTDIGELKAIVQEFKPKGTVHVQDVYAAASPFSASSPNLGTSVRSMDVTMAGLNSLVRALAGYSGRKNLIWVSEGFPITMFPEIISDNPTAIGRDTANPMAAPIGTLGNLGITQGAGKDFEEAVEKLANALMNAQVAVYPIDSAGLQKDNHVNQINTMRSLADRTGGKAFYNRNDIEVGIASSLDDGSSYYTLEYYPQNKTWDGKFRTIQIKGRQGVSLRYRQGYYALDPGVLNKDEEKTLARTFSDALGLDVPSATGVVFHAGVAPSPAKGQQVTVNFAIDPHTVAFEHKSDGLEHAMVSCAVAAFSDKGAPVKQEITNLTASMKQDEFETMMKGQQIPCKRTIDLKPGSYNLTLGVLDRNSRLIGTTTAWVKVP